jgi:hypothetical protein
MQPPLDKGMIVGGDSKTSTLPRYLLSFADHRMKARLDLPAHQ